MSVIASSRLSSRSLTTISLTTSSLERCTASDERWPDHIAASALTQQRSLASSFPDVSIPSLAIIAAGGVAVPALPLRRFSEKAHLFFQASSPPSLPSLRLGKRFGQSLQHTSLPQGLLYLRFIPFDISRLPVLPPLLPGVLPPSTLLSLDLSDRCHGEQQLAGVLPSSLRWLRLPESFGRPDIEAVLSSHAPHAHCDWVVTRP